MSDIQENKTTAIKRFLTSGRFLKPFLSIIIGGLAGYLYYYFVGCNSGQCAITSNPYNSIIFGSFFGFFLTSSPCANNKC